MNDAALALSTFADGPNTLVAAIVAPFLLMLACASERLRKFGPLYLIVAPLFALFASIFASDSGPFVLDQMIYPIVLVLDPPGALLLGATAFLWTSAGVFAASFMWEEASGGAFSAYWLATLIGNIGVFMAADVASFYLFFALVSLPAYGLIVARSRAQDEAGGLYVAVALLGEAFLILAFALIASAAPDHSLLISDGVAALPASPWRDATIALLIAGFGTKIGLLPLHIWMPSTYRSAPVPAAAVLSGGAVNAGVIGLLRFFPWGHAVPVWGEGLLVLGMFAAFYGVAVGLTQRNPKTILAYSSVSQMGLITATMGAGLVAGNAGASAGAALYAAHHGLAKGGLFLAVGVMSGCGALWMRRLTPFVGLLALSLAGLPISGGVIAKLAIKESLGDGLIGALSILSAIATTLLMLHFLRLVVALAEPRVAPPGWALIAPWCATIIASIIIPAADYFLVKGYRLDVLGPDLFWEALWPVLVGALLYAVGRRLLDRLPALPEGDIGAFAAKLFVPIAHGGAFVDRGEIVLHKWPVAAGALLVVAIVISGAGMLKL
jgi:formate hydrogenlyase subunit 3/multisubunit Na+/H+ antiporter MnhD subunit